MKKYWFILILLIGTVFYYTMWVTLALNDPTSTLFSWIYIITITPFVVALLAASFNEFLSGKMVTLISLVIYLLIYIMTLFFINPNHRLPIGKNNLCRPDEQVQGYCR